MSIFPPQPGSYGRGDEGQGCLAGLYKGRGRAVGDHRVIDGADAGLVVGQVAADAVKLAFDVVIFSVSRVLWCSNSFFDPPKARFDAVAQAVELLGQ